MTTLDAHRRLRPGPSRPPIPLERVAEALRSHNIEAIVVETAAEARDAVLAMIPDGAEVHSGKSKTLEDVGLYAELVESGPLRRASGRG